MHLYTKCNIQGVDSVCIYVNKAAIFSHFDKDATTRSTFLPSFFLDTVFGAGDNADDLLLQGIANIRMNMKMNMDMNMNIKPLLSLSPSVVATTTEVEKEVSVRNLASFSNNLRHPWHKRHCTAVLAFNLERHCLTENVLSLPLKSTVRHGEEPLIVVTGGEDESILVYLSSEVRNESRDMMLFFSPELYRASFYIYTYKLWPTNILGKERTYTVNNFLMATLTEQGTTYEP